jgi:HPr kinase/phosphorylase
VTGAAGAQLLHAGCVELDGRGALLMGPSGSGKSALALSLMAFGCRLVSDDRTWISAEGGHLVARAPKSIAGMIEARGIGLLRADAVASAVLALAVDLGQRETARMPVPRRLDLAGQSLPLLYAVEGAHLAAAIVQYLRCGPAE